MDLSLTKIDKIVYVHLRDLISQKGTALLVEERPTLIKIGGSAWAVDRGIFQILKLKFA